MRNKENDAILILLIADIPSAIVQGQRFAVCQVLLQGVHLADRRRLPLMKNGISGKEGDSYDLRVKAIEYYVFFNTLFLIHGSRIRRLCG